MRFEFPKGIALDASGYVYVADDAKHRIQKSDTNGNFRKEWGRKGSDKAEFKFPKGVAVDASGFVYVTDDENHRVQKFDTNDNFISEWGKRD
ncbi:hypothetical protein YTPLAS21_20250 [Candidatus Nitrosocosmicus sp.]|nr:hypothetical protein YTPLAS21_20250 [Candidatus Nitrosocosmicus sp.]